jgi:hypothetical protein
VRVTEFDLIRAAHGSGGAASLIAALRDSVADAVPGAVVGILSRDTVALVIDADTERAGIDRAVRERFVERVRTRGFGDAPELRVLYRGITDDAQLDAFFAAATTTASLSPRWWTGRSRSERTGTPTAG